MQGRTEHKRTEGQSKFVKNFTRMMRICWTGNGGKWKIFQWYSVLTVSGSSVTLFTSFSKNYNFRTDHYTYKTYSFCLMFFLLTKHLLFLCNSILRGILYDYTISIISGNGMVYTYLAEVYTRIHEGKSYLISVCFRWFSGRKETQHHQVI